MVYRFADCELDEHLYQLRRNDAPVALEPKVFDVLVYLLQHRDAQQIVRCQISRHHTPSFTRHSSVWHASTRRWDFAARRPVR